MNVRTQITPAQSNKLLFEKSKAGKEGVFLPRRQFPSQDFHRLVPSALQRQTAADLPELTEPELVRHFVNLSRKNFSVDTHFYPLGSCTMKYNPKIHEDIAALDTICKERSIFEVIWNKIYLLLYTFYKPTTS